MEEEDIPTYDDLWDAYKAACAGKKCIECSGCGLPIPIRENEILVCPRCGYAH